MITALLKYNLQKVRVKGLCVNVCVVRLKTITESGCDSVTTVRVEYRVGKTDSWKSVEPDTVSATSVTIDSLSDGRYEVRLVVINNEKITSTSASEYITLRYITLRE